MLRLTTLSLCVLLTGGLLARAADPPALTPRGGEPNLPTLPTRTKPLIVGFSQMGAESAWRTAETESIRGEATRRGITLKFSDAQGQQENQIKAVGAFIAQKVDAIIIAPKVETGWEPILREAKRAHIPVILVDRRVKVSDETLYTTLIASDFVEEGRMAARWLADKLGGKGDVVELQGTPGASAANDRKKGFAEALAKFPGIKITKSQSGDFKRAGGKEVMEVFLKASEGKSIRAVYAHNDDMALGAIQAIEAAGLKPGTDIVVISIDGIRDAFDAIIAGKLNATIECNPLLGPAAFDAVEAVLAGKELPKWTKVPDRLFDSSNAQAELPNRKY